MSNQVLESQTHAKKLNSFLFWFLNKKRKNNSFLKLETYLGWSGSDCNTPVRCSCPNGTPMDNACTFPNEVKCSSCIDGYSGDDCSIAPVECNCANGIPSDTGTCTTMGQVSCKQCFFSWTGADCNTPIVYECPNGTPGSGCPRVGMTLCDSCNPGWEGTDCTFLTLSEVFCLQNHTFKESPVFCFFFLAL